MKFVSPDISQWPLVGRVFNLRVRSKLLVTLGALLVPVLLLVFLLGMKSFEQIRFVRAELAGMSFEQPISDLIRGVARHRQSTMFAVEGTTFPDLPTPESLARECDEAMLSLDAVVAGQGGDWGIAFEWQKIRSDWSALKNEWRQLDAHGNDVRHEELIQLMTRLQLRVAGTTNLTLDPEAGSFAFMDVGLIKMPALLLDVVDVAGDATASALRGQITQGERLEIQGHHRVIESRDVDLQFALQDGLSAVPESREEIAPRAAAFQTALARFQETLVGDFIADGAEGQARQRGLERILIQRRDGVDPAGGLTEGRQPVRFLKDAAGTRAAAPRS